MSLKAIPVGFLLVASMSTAQAQQFYVSGEGATSCGTYLEHRRTQGDTQSYVYVTWVRGFLSGYNFATIGKQVNLGPSTKDTILAYLDTHCRNNPLHVVASGAIQFAKDLGGTTK
jgi:hypothetical protein